MTDDPPYGHVAVVFAEIARTHEGCVRNPSLVFHFVHSEDEREVE
jgi:hypothetical protein